MTEDEVPEIRHARWRHKTLNYEVQVLDTRNYGCPVTHRTVTVNRTQFGQKARIWTAQRFVAEFEPIGKPLEARELWDYL